MAMSNALQAPIITIGHTESAMMINCPALEAESRLVSFSESTLHIRLFVSRFAHNSKLQAASTMNTPSPALAALIAVLVYGLYRLLSIGKRPKGYPPGPPTIPVLGNIHLVSTLRCHYLIPQLTPRRCQPKTHTCNSKNGLRNMATSTVCASKCDRSECASKPTSSHSGQDEDYSRIVVVIGVVKPMSKALSR